MARTEKHFLQLMSETKLFQPLAGLVALLVYAGCPPRTALAAATRPTQTAMPSHEPQAKYEQIEERQGQHHIL